MSKKKIIILSSLIVLSFLIVTISAAFMFHAEINGTGATGTIELENKYFLDYSTKDKNKNKGTDLKQFLLDLKEREKNPLNIKKIPIKDSNAQESELKNKISCYATERGGYSDETLEDDLYLNQLGFEFSYRSKLDSYVRIHFEDAWISTKIYNNGTVKTSYIKKDKLKDENGNPLKSPFQIENIVANTGGKPETLPIYYDEKENYLYIQTLINGSESLHNYSFHIAENYFYPPAPAKAYRERIVVQVSYIVDIVQANRAEAKWGVDMSTILQTKKGV